MNEKLLFRDIGLLKLLEVEKLVLIAGGLPPQNNTYEADYREADEIKEDFYQQAKMRHYLQLMEHSFAVV